MAPFLHIIWVLLSVVGSKSRLPSLSFFAQAHFFFAVYFWLPQSRIWVRRIRLIHGCFYQALMSGGEKTRDVFKPFGTPQPQVSAGLPMLESVLFKSRKEKDLMDPQTLWNAVFVIDPRTNSVNPEERTPAHMLRGRSEFLKLMVFVFYAEKLWNLLICPGHPLLHRLWDEDVCLYSELFPSFSRWGTGSLIVFPLVCFANPLSKLAPPALQPS